MAAISHSPDLVLALGEDESDLETQIDKLTEFIDAIKLGKKFQPQVSMKGIQEIEMAQQRLKLALKKIKGNMKDHGAMGDALTGMRQGDHASRIKLRELIVKLQRQMNKIDENLTKQFKFESATRDAIPEGEKYKQFLEKEKSIILVAGEVSSGKSTLLNLILSQDILPAKRLSCTFTVCELVHDETQKACILFDDGKPSQEIPFEDREKYIYKPTSRHKTFEHSGVRLYLPFTLLQSGITLVDTPGVGEYSTTEQIVLDYVRRNEVFGFIFTINAFDSGGVRLKFKEMLHKLSEIEDIHNHRKLNPPSVICVVNFWDKVPEEEKEGTREEIEYYLEKMPFMGKFDPKKQLFFMDSQGAFESLNLKTKLITDDFERLIDGIREYFPVGQKLKLEKSYLWLQEVFERLIHPVKTLLVKQRPGDRSTEISEKIEEVQRQYKGVISEARNKYKIALSELSNKLFKSLPEQRNKVMAWKTDDIPTRQPDESWPTYEERLDKAVDDRISQVIVDLEQEHKVISKAYGTLADEVYGLINNILNKLGDIERELRNNVTRGMRRRASALEPIYEQLSIQVTIGRDHGAKWIVPKFTAKTMIEQLIYGPKLVIFGLKQHQRRQAIEQEMEKFDSNPSASMSLRSEVIYKHFCTTENINEFVQRELKKIQEYIAKNEIAIPEQIESNKSLLQYATKIATKIDPNDSKYRVFLEEIQKLYDELLLLGRESIVTDTFRQDDIKIHTDGTLQRNPELRRDESMPQYFSRAELQYPRSSSKAKSKRSSISSDVLSKPTEKITLMEFNASSSCVLRYRETDRYNHQTNLGNRVANERAPEYLGTYNYGQALVLQGHLFTARSQAPRKILPLKFKWQGHINTLMALLGDLGRALCEIHLKKMAHCILSLDTLLLDKTEDFAIRLTNLFELATIQINESEDLQTGQLLYLAPEILFGDQKLYTTAADVYALGLIMIELWYHYDVFNDLKKLHFKKFKEQYKGNTGQLLLLEAERVMEEINKSNENASVFNMPEKYKNLVCECLNVDEGRLDMGMWTEMWDAHKENVQKEAKRCISLH